MSAADEPFDQFPGSAELVSASSLADARAQEPAQARAEDFLAMCRVAPNNRGPHRDLYVVGSYDDSVTIYRQQVRAMNLVHALSLDSALANASVAVIGGGVSGATAAVAAALAGARVSIFERSGSWVSTQSRASHRFVHPHLYEWPDLGREASDQAGLPFLTWSAGDGARVAEGLASEFRDRCSGLGINAVTRARVVRIERQGNQWRVGLDPPATSPAEAFDHVLLSIGFGTERCSGPGSRADDTAPYWFPDALERVRHECDEPAHVTVVGGGDGGLIDAVRSAVAVSHESLFRRVFASPAARALALEMREIDKIRDEDRVDNFGGDDTSEPYRTLTARTDAATAELKLDQLQATTLVCLVTRGPNPYALNTALVNRLLVLCLTRMGRIKWRNATFEGVSGRPGALTVASSPALPPPFANPAMALVRIGPEKKCLDEALPELQGGVFGVTTRALDTLHLRALRGRHIRLTPEARAYFAAQVGAVQGKALAAASTVLAPDGKGAASSIGPPSRAASDTASGYDRALAPKPDQRATPAQTQRPFATIRRWCTALSAAIDGTSSAKSGELTSVVVAGSGAPGPGATRDPSTKLPDEAPDARGQSRRVAPIASNVEVEASARSVTATLFDAGRRRVRIATPVLGEAEGKSIRLEAVDGNHGNIEALDDSGLHLKLDRFDVPLDVLRDLGNGRIERKMFAIDGGLPLVVPWEMLGKPWPDAVERKLQHIRVHGAVVRWDGRRWVLDA